MKWDAAKFDDHNSYLKWIFNTYVNEGYPLLTTYLNSGIKKPTEVRAQISNTAFLKNGYHIGHAESEIDSGMGVDALNFADKVYKELVLGIDFKKEKKGWTLGFVNRPKMPGWRARNITQRAAAKTAIEQREKSDQSERYVLKSLVDRYIEKGFYGIYEKGKWLLPDIIKSFKAVEFRNAFIKSRQNIIQTPETFEAEINIPFTEFMGEELTKNKYLELCQTRLGLTIYEEIIIELGLIAEDDDFAYKIYVEMYTLLTTFRKTFWKNYTESLQKFEAGVDKLTECNDIIDSHETAITTALTEISTGGTVDKSLKSDLKKLAAGLKDIVKASRELLEESAKEIKADYDVILTLLTDAHLDKIIKEIEPAITDPDLVERRQILQMFARALMEPYVLMIGEYMLYSLVIEKYSDVLAEMGSK